MLPTEAEFKEGRVTFNTGTGVADAYTVTSTYPISSYVNGFTATVSIPAANTGMGLLGS